MQLPNFLISLSLLTDKVKILEKILQNVPLSVELSCQKLILQPSPKEKPRPTATIEDQLLRENRGLVMFLHKPENLL